MSSINYAGNGLFNVTQEVIVRDGNGNVTYDGNGNPVTETVTKTLDIASLDMMLRSEQVEQYDQEVADQYAEIKASNEKRKALNDLLAKMRSYKSEGRDDDTKADGSWGGDEQHGTELSASNSDESKGSDRFYLDGQGTEARSVDGWMDYFGLTKTDVQFDAKGDKRDSQWDANIEAVKGLVDEVTSDSEMMMLRFRQLVDKRSTALQEAKSTMQSDKQLKDRILQ
ncbi:hypothetical protein GC197_08865 [bacterium]|nr:hypothetical protein [bacterium]